MRWERCGKEEACHRHVVGEHRSVVCDLDEVEVRLRRVRLQRRVLSVVERAHALEGRKLLVGWLVAQLLRQLEVGSEDGLVVDVHLNEHGAHGGAVLVEIQ